MVNRLNWEDPKRNIVGSLVDFLAGHEERHQDALIRLMLDVAAIDDFAHLERLDAGQSKAEAAMAALTKALASRTAATRSRPFASPAAIADESVQPLP